LIAARRGCKFKAAGDGAEGPVDSIDPTKEKRLAK
jgi:hypothetical protein